MFSNFPVLDKFTLSVGVQPELFDRIDFRYGARAGGEKYTRVRPNRGLVIGPFHASV